jgi:hypothetical protein
MIHLHLAAEQVAVDRVGTSRGIGPAGFGDRFGHRGFLSVLVAQVNGLVVSYWLRLAMTPPTPHTAPVTQPSS